MSVTAARPARDRLVAVGAMIWGVTFGALRDFVWADLRNGLIDLRGLPISTRVLIWLAVGVLAVLLGMLLVGDTWRAQSPLVALPRGVPGRGALVPTILVPVTLLMFTVSWSLILTGALNAAAQFRLPVLGLYLLTVANWADLPALGEWGAVGAAPDVWLGLGGLVGVPILLAGPWRVRGWPALQFVVLLLLVAATVAPAQARGLDTWRITGVPVIMAQVEDDLSSLQLLIMPLLLLIGIEVATFVRQAAEWGTEVVAARLPRWAPWAVLALFGGWRLRGVGLDAASRVEEAAVMPALLGFGGALLAPIGMLLAYWAVARLAHSGSKGTGITSIAPDDVAQATERRAMPLVAAYTAMGLVAFVLNSIAGTLASFGLLGAAQTLIGLATAVNALATPWFLLVDVVVLGLGLWLARRGARSLALYLVSFSVLRLWWEATRPDRPLASLDPAGWNAVDAWWVVTAMTAALVWLVSGRLTRRRALHVVFILLVTALLSQTEFIESKFGPLFGWAGIGFIAFGIAWDALTKGAWANRDTVALPRTARILLYLGYALLSVTVITWVVAAHDLFSVRLFTGGGAMLGFAAFGRPMIYAAIVATLLLPTRTPGVEAR